MHQEYIIIQQCMTNLSSLTHMYIQCEGNASAWNVKIHSKLGIQEHLEEIKSKSNKHP